MVNALGFIWTIKLLLMLGIIIFIEQWIEYVRHYLGFGRGQMYAALLSSVARSFWLLEAMPTKWLGSNLAIVPKHNKL